MTRWITPPLLLAALSAHAGQPATAPSDDELKQHIGNGAEIEARLDADLTGDGLPDTAFVARADGRILMVLAAAREGERIVHRAIGEAGLPDDARVPATLMLRRNVLLVKDRTGGTTVTTATYRYRRDRGAGRMRLIGIDAERYGRTGAHPPLRISWNLLTGEHLAHYAPPAREGGGGNGHEYALPERTRRPAAGPVWMEDTPDPEELLLAETIPEDEDRD